MSIYDNRGNFFASVIFASKITAVAAALAVLTYVPLFAKEKSKNIDFSKAVAEWRMPQAEEQLDLDDITETLIANASPEDADLYSGMVASINETMIDGSSNTGGDKEKSKIDTGKIHEFLDVVCSDYTDHQKDMLVNLVNWRENNIGNIYLNDLVNPSTEMLKQIKAINTIKDAKKKEAYIDRLIEKVPIEAVFATSMRHYDMVVDTARRFNVPEEIMVAIMTLENGGGDNINSFAKCRGIFQFWGPTERNVKKKANKYGRNPPFNVSKDERDNPKVSAELAARLLKENYEFFGKWDFAVQAYHDGPGSVYSSIGKWLKLHKGVNAPKGIDNARNVIEKYDIKLIDVIADKNAKGNWAINLAKKSNRENEYRGYFPGLVFMYHGLHNQEETVALFNSHRLARLEKLMEIGSKYGVAFPDKYLQKVAKK